MKQMLKHIDTRFDRIDGQFSDVNRKIDYVHVQIEFGIIEQKIFAVGAQFEKLYNAPSAAAKNLKRIFISNYESDFQNSGQKLYDGIMNSNNVFTESLGEAAMQYTETFMHIMDVATRDIFVYKNHPITPEIFSS
jgi:hypothetical protein